jgi:hypothetical protein
MGARALLYPLAAVLVPVVWWTRGRRPPYPHGIDALVVLPFVVDMAGNALALFDRVDHFDEVAHLLNWALLVAAFGLAVSRTGIGRLNAWALAVGFGATTHLLWELAEYVVMTLGFYGLDLTYTDTIGDLAVSFLGTLLGAVVTLVAPRRARVGPRSGLSR